MTSGRYAKDIEMGSSYAILVATLENGICIVSYDWFGFGPKPPNRSELIVF